MFRCFDLDADNFVSHEEFVKGMSTLLKGKYDDHVRCNFCLLMFQFVLKCMT